MHHHMKNNCHITQRLPKQADASLPRSNDVNCLCLCSLKREAKTLSEQLKFNLWTVN